MSTEQLMPSVMKPWMNKYPKGLLPDLEAAACSLNDGLFRNNLDNMFGTALCYCDRNISFKEMKDNIWRSARALVKIGVHPGEIITICSPAVPELIYLIYAMDLIGAVPHLLDPEMEMNGLHQQISKVKSRIVVTINTAYSKVQKAIAGTVVGKVLVLSRTDSMRGLKKTIYGLQNRDKNKYDANAVMWLDFYYLGMDPLDELNVMEYSHDSTAILLQNENNADSIVMLSAFAVNAAAMQYGVDHYALRERSLNLVQPASVFGFVCGIHGALMHGTSVILLSDPMTEDLGTFVMKTKPDHLCGLAADFESLCKNQKVQEADLSFLKTTMCWGEISKESEKQISLFLKSHECLYPLTKVFGFAEMASAATAERGLFNKPGSFGFPLCYTEAGIFETGTDQELNTNSIGEICFSGPGLMRGYFNDPEGSATVLKRHSDGKIWLHSAIMGIITEDGFLYPAKNMQQPVRQVEEFFDAIDAGTIERKISRHPNVAYCAIVDVADSARQIEPQFFAYIKWKDESSDVRRKSMAEVRRFCEKQLPESCIPSGFMSVRGFPQGADNAIDYDQLKRKAVEILLKR